MSYDPWGWDPWGGAARPRRGAGGLQGSGDSLSKARSRLYEQLDAIANSGAPGSDGAIDDATQEGGGDENLFMKALSIIDKPRAIMVAGSKQIGNALGAATGASDGDFGWDEFSADVGRNIGVGDILEEDGSRLFGTDRGTEHMNIWAKRGLGFAGDVALDPLTYLAPQASVAKLGKPGLVRVALEGGLDDVAAKIGRQGFAHLDDGERALLTKAAREQGAIDEAADLMGGLHFNKPGSGPVGRRVQRAVGVKDPQLAQWKIPGVQGPARAVSRGVASATSGVRDGALGRGLSKVFTAKEKRELLDLVRSGDGATARRGFETLNARRLAQVHGASFRSHASFKMDALHREMLKAGIGGEEASLALEAGDGSVQALAIEARAPGLFEKMKSTRDELHKLANEEARGADGDDWLPFRQNYSYRSLSDEFRDLKPGAQDQGAKNVLDPHGIEKKANVVAGGEFLGETLLPATDQAAADLMAATGKQLPVHPDGLTPSQQAQRLIDEATDEAVDIFDHDFYKASNAWVSAVGHRVEGKVLVNELKARGVAEEVGKKVELTKLGRKRAKLLRELQGQKLAMAVDKHIALARSEAATAARQVADGTAGDLRAARAQQAALEGAAARAAQDAAQPKAHKGAAAVREYGEMRLRRSNASAYAADLLDMRISDNVAREEAFGPRLAEQVAEHEAALNVEAAKVASLKRQLDEAYGGMEDSLARLDDELIDAQDKLELIDDVRAREAEAARLLEWHDKRLPNGWAKAQAKVDELTDELAEILAAEGMSGRLDELGAIRVRAKARKAEIRVAAQGHADEIAELETQLRAVEAPTRVRRNQFDSDEAFQAAVEDVRIAEASQAVEVEALGAQRSAAMDRLAASLREAERVQSLDTQLAREESMIRKLESLVAGPQEQSLAAARAELSRIQNKHSARVDGLKAELESLEAEKRSLGMTAQAEQVARVRARLATVDEDGYLHFEGTDIDQPEVRSWPDTDPDGESASTWWHGSSSEVLNLPAGADGNLRGPTLETNNHLGLHVSAHRRVADGFAKGLGETGPSMGSATPWHVRSQQPRLYLDPRDGPNFKSMDQYAPRKGWGAAQLDGEMLLGALDDGAFDLRSMKEAVDDHVVEAAIDDVADYLDAAKVDGPLFDPTAPPGSQVSEHAYQVGRILDGDHNLGDLESWRFGLGNITVDPYEIESLEDEMIEALGLQFLSDAINPQLHTSAIPELSASALRTRSATRLPSGARDVVAVYDDFLVVAAIADAHTAKIAEAGYDVSVFHDVGKDLQAIVHDTARLEKAGAESSVQRFRQDPAAAGADALEPRQVDVPTAPRTPKLQATVSAQRGAVDLAEYERALYGQMANKRIALWQTKADMLGVDLAIQSGRADDARVALARAKTQYKDQLHELALERKTLQPKKLAAIEESNRELLAAQELFRTADELEAQHARALNDQSVEAGFEAAAARGDVIDAHNANQRALVEALRLEGQAKLAEASLDRWTPKVQKKMAKLEKIGDDPKTLERIVFDFKEGTHKAIDWDTIAPNDVADILLDVEKAMTPEGMRGFFTYFDKATAMFKSWAVATPGFHSRNYIGGLFNNWLAGVEGGTTTRFLRADRSFRQAMVETAGDEASSLAAIKDPKVRAAYSVLYSSRVLDSSGQVGSELAAHLNVGGGGFGPEAAVGRAWRGPIRNTDQSIVGRGMDRVTSNPITRLNYEASTKVERVLRGSLALDTVLKGGNADAALERVYKYHFNYDDLSAIEKGAFKRLIPFYTWTRKNLPLQFEGIVTNPKVYARYYQLKNELELGSSEAEIVPSYYSALIPIQLTSGAEPIYLTPDLPFNALAEPFDKGQILGSLNPLIKTPLELQAGKQFFSDVPFKKGYVEAPTAWGPLLPALGAIGKARQVDGQWMMRDQDAYLIEQFMPAMGRARRAMPSEEKYSQRWGTTMASMMFGVGLRHNTKSAQASELYRRSRKLEDLNEDNRSLGYGGYYEFSDMVATDKGYPQ